MSLKILKQGSYGNNFKKKEKTSLLKRSLLDFYVEIKRSSSKSRTNPGVSEAEDQRVQVLYSYLL